MREHADITRSVETLKLLCHLVRQKMTMGQVLDSLIPGTPPTFANIPDKQLHAAMVARLQQEHASQRSVKSVHISDDEASLAVA